MKVCGARVLNLCMSLVDTLPISYINFSASRSCKVLTVYVEREGCLQFGCAAPCMRLGGVERRQPISRPLSAKLKWA